jgi:hypothetical protein
MLWLAGFAAGLLLVTAGLVRLFDAAGVAQPFVDIEAMGGVERTAAELARRPRRGRELRVAFLGDSTSLHTERERGVDHRIEEALAPLAPALRRTRVFSFASPGFSPFAYYFLSHRIAAARPDRAILSFNLYALTDLWRAIDRPRIAGWLPARALPHALTLPLHQIGLKTDLLLLYTALVRLGAAEAWLRLSRAQARSSDAWIEAEAWLRQRGPWPDDPGYRLVNLTAQRAAWFMPGVPERETPGMARRRLAAALAGVPRNHPVLQMLGAALVVLEARGVDTCVYVAPVNVEHHERIGAYRREDLRPTVASVQQVVEARGARFVDLSTLLPDAAFADGHNHLTAEGPLDAPGTVARALAEACQEDGAAASR